MFLSRVEIDMKNRQKIKDLTHLGAYHNWVEESFPDEMAAGIRNRHLWRIDTLHGKQYLLVLSESQPNPQKLVTYGVEGTVQVKSYDRFLASLVQGQTMRFRLTANPTYAVMQPGSDRGKVYPHVTVQQQRQWLVNKSAKAGFKVLGQANSDGTDNFTFDVVSRERVPLHRKSGRGIRLSQVTFEGQLKIDDLELFKQALTQGIGREKAFGMGLMTVIPEG